MNVKGSTAYHRSDHAGGGKAWLETLAQHETPGWPYRGQKQEGLTHLPPPLSPADPGIGGAPGLFLPHCTAESDSMECSAPVATESASAPPDSQRSPLRQQAGCPPESTSQGVGMAGEVIPVVPL